MLVDAKLQHAPLGAAAGCGLFTMPPGASLHGMNARTSRRSPALGSAVLLAAQAGAQPIPIVDLHYRPTDSAVTVQLDGRWQQPCSQLLNDDGRTGLVHEVMRTWPTSLIALAWGGSQSNHLPATLPAREHWRRTVGSLSIASLGSYLQRSPDEWPAEIGMANAIRIIGDLELIELGPTVAEHVDNTTNLLLRAEALATFARLDDRDQPDTRDAAQTPTHYRDVPRWTVAWVRLRPQSADFWSRLIASRRREFTKHLRTEWMNAAGSIPPSQWEIAQWALDVPEILPFEAARLCGLWGMKELMLACSTASEQRWEMRARGAFDTDKIQRAMLASRMERLGEGTYRAGRVAIHISRAEITLTQGGEGAERMPIDADHAAEVSIGFVGTSALVTCRPTHRLELRLWNSKANEDGGPTEIDRITAALERLLGRKWQPLDSKRAGWTRERPDTTTWEMALTWDEFHQAMWTAGMR